MPAEQLVNDAWVGDAVLCLYARTRILELAGKVDGALFIRLTSNQFLSAFGEPTKVEAEIGKVFARDGLEAAYRWIEDKLLPLFERQEENRIRKNLNR